MVRAVLSAWRRRCRARIGNPAVRLLAVAALCGCAPGRITVTEESSAVGLPRPSAVYVYDFAVQPSEVRLDPGGPLERLRERLAGGEAGEQDTQAIALGHEVAAAVGRSLVQRISAMGLPAVHIDRPNVPPVDAVAVGGQFVDVDQGNRIRRIAIGFHQGQSRVAAQVQLYRVTGSAAAARLLSFTAVAESAPLPGAAVTMGAGAAVQVAGAAAGARALSDSVQADADRLAERIATSLQEFFAELGMDGAAVDPALAVSNRAGTGLSGCGATAFAFRFP